MSVVRPKGPEQHLWVLRPAPPKGFAIVGDNANAITLHCARHASNSPVVRPTYISAGVEPRCLKYPSLVVPTRGKGRVCHAAAAVVDPEVAARRVGVVCHVCSMYSNVFNVFVFSRLHVFVNVCLRFL